MNKRRSTSGRRFGRLVVVKRVPAKDCKFECICDCGNTTEVFKTNLYSNQTQSCGCRLKEVSAEKFRTHGLARHYLYRKLMNIIARCYDKNSRSYKNYGGRGIKVCDEWVNDYSKFFDWCEKNGYKKELQIDRIDTNGNYEPSNCRFVTASKNTQNTRKSKYWYVDGVRYNSSREAAEYYPVCRQTIENWCNKEINNCYCEKKYSNSTE